MAQVQDFLMRVRSKRFPSIEQDMKMLQAHSGSLLLDPAALAQVCCLLALRARQLFLRQSLLTADVGMMPKLST